MVRLKPDTTTVTVRLKADTTTVVYRAVKMALKSSRKVACD
jgi:hypothetical protein